MKAAATQKARNDNRIRIVCSAERLARMVCAIDGVNADEIVDEVPRWLLVPANDLGRFVNFANIFLYGGNAVIKVVDEEPASRLVQVAS